MRCIRCGFFHSLLGLTVVCLLAAFVGCGRGQTTSVTGHIMVDGHPVDRGSILFSPLEAAGGTTGGQIVDGRYSVSRGLMPGTYRVEVRQPRPSSRMVAKPFGKPGETIPGVEENISSDANEESRLEVKVMVGKNVADFQLRARAR